MKRILLFVILILASIDISLNIYADDADNKLTTAFNKTAFSQSDTKATLQVFLDNKVTITGIQFDMLCPTGITVPSNTPEAPSFVKTGYRLGGDDTHELSHSIQADGSYRVLFVSMDNCNFLDEDASGNDLRNEPIIEIRLNLNELAFGVHDVIFKNILVTHYSSEKGTVKYKLNDFSAKLVVKPEENKVEKYVEEKKDSSTGGESVTVKIASMATGENAKVTKEGYKEFIQSIISQGGDTPGGDTPGGDTPGGDTPGGDTPGGDTPGGDTPGGDTPQEESKKADIAVVDLRAAEIDMTEITVEDLRENLEDNAIVILPEGTDIESTEGSKNIVVNDECQQFEINDNSAFATPIPFVAREATYLRDLSKLGTICLPYKPNTKNFNYYRLVESKENSLNFELEDEPEANVPYLINKKDNAEGSSITAKNVQISTTVAGQGSVEKNNVRWEINGTFTEVTFKSSNSGNIYALSDGILYLNMGTLVVPPFHAYFSTTDVSGVKEMNVVIDGEYTGIVLTKDGQVIDSNAMYNLAGQKVGLDYKGIVIIDGKKVLRK